MPPWLLLMLRMAPPVGFVIPLFLDVCVGGLDRHLFWINHRLHDLDVAIDRMVNVEFILTGTG